MRVARLAAALAVVLLSASGSATEAGDVPVNLGQMTLGYTYFNKPGADLKSHDADAVDCAAKVGGLISMTEVVEARDRWQAGVLKSFLLGSLASAYHRGAVAAGLENCMVVRGWRVVKLPDDEGQALTKLPPRNSRLASTLGSAPPTRMARSSGSGTTTPPIRPIRVSRSSRIIPTVANSA